MLWERGLFVDEMSTSEKSAHQVRCKIVRVLDTLPDFRNENPTPQHKVKSGVHPAAIAQLPPEGSRRGE